MYDLYNFSITYLMQDRSTRGEIRGFKSIKNKVFVIICKCCIIAWKNRNRDLRLPIAVAQSNNKSGALSHKGLLTLLYCLPLQKMIKCINIWLTLLKKFHLNFRWWRHKSTTKHTIEPKFHRIKPILHYQHVIFFQKLGWCVTSFCWQCYIILQACTDRTESGK